MTRMNRAEAYKKPKKSFAGLRQDDAQNNLIPIQKIIGIEILNQFVGMDSPCWTEKTIAYLRRITDLQDRGSIDKRHNE